MALCAERATLGAGLLGRAGGVRGVGHEDEAGVFGFAGDGVCGAGINLRPKLEAQRVQ